MRRALGKVDVSHRATVQRSDSVTRMRVAAVKKYKCLEVTGFLEFEEVILFNVLLTSVERQASNIRRLEAILGQAIPMKVTFDNSAPIARLQKELEVELSVGERTSLLLNIGHLYRETGENKKACESLEEGLSLDPKNFYYIIRELLPVLTKLGDKKRALEVMAFLLRLDPHNPTVFNDCINFAAGWIERTEVLKLLDLLKRESGDDKLAEANCDFYAGNVLMVDAPSKAKERFMTARKSFRFLLPNNHDVFRSLREVLRRCNQFGEKASKH